eukprot:2622579-Prymnesium_polylepis.1
MPQKTRSRGVNVTSHPLDAHPRRFEGPVPPPGPAYRAMKPLRPSRSARPYAWPYGKFDHRYQYTTHHSDVTVPFTHAKNFVLMPIRARLSTTRTTT